MRKTIIIFVLILSALLRLWRLGDYPALNADEAAIGYNAYSLLETGKDEHGNSWPIHFQSFNDYKPGLYVYIVMPFVKLLGLNEWAVKLPNALFGIATVYLLYLLVKQLNMRGAQVAAFFLAISPWHIHFSRGGWEVNTATFLIVLGVYLFFVFIKKGKFLTLDLSLLSFLLSLYTYHSARIITPLLLIGLGLIYLRDFKARLTLGRIVLSLTLLLVMGTPLLKDFMGPAGISRVSGVGLFADKGPLNRVNEQRSEHVGVNSLIVKLIHNKPVNYFLAFVQNWSDHYHGEFLFVSGDDIQRSKVPETGQMYLFDVILIIFGIVFIIKSSINNKSSIFVLYWLFIAPIAASLTFQSPHALRAQNMVIPLVIISSVGFISLIDYLKSFFRNKSMLLIPCYVLLTILVAWQFGRYLQMYYLHMSKEYPYSSQYGVKELVAYVSSHEKDFEKIVITDKYDQPYILFLFYMKYPPEKFQSEHVLTGRDKYGFSTVRNFGKFYFENIDWDLMRDFRNTLLVGVPGDFNIDANISEKIYFPNGQVVFEIVPL